MGRGHPRAVRFRPQGTAASFLLPLAAGGVLSSYDPRLAIGAGGVTLAVATFYEKDWRWWLAGMLILVVGLIFQWFNQIEKK